MKHLALLLCASLSTALLSVAATRAADRPSGVAAAGWSDNDVQKLKADINRILARRVLRGTHIGLVAIDTVRGKVLYSRNADDEFMPASNFKLLVGSAALRTLGLAFTFKTTVSTDGTNLYLKGGGDAHLTATDLDAAAAKVAAGSTHFSGALVTDASYFGGPMYQPGWSWDDLPYYYAPLVSALSLEENVLHLYFRPGAAVGMPAVLRVEPQTTAFKVDNEITTGARGSKDTTDIVRDFSNWNTVKLTGSYPIDAKESGDVRPAVPDPAAYAGDVFLQALRTQRVTIDGGVRSGAQPAGAQLLWSHDSEPMPKLLADFWQPSDNLMGELFLLALGVARGSSPDAMTAGVNDEQTFLKSIGIDASTVSIADGSGLSQYDRITPRDLLTILQHDWNSPNRNVVIDALPQSGVSGSLKTAYIGTPAEKNVFAKTGSISHVRTISGFLRTRRHGTVTFSFMLDDWLEDADALAKLRAELFSRMITE
ncbi:MAG: D-alanyl-D-alanine carboxypeptidase/D-alanyl-D-alanine-endopeptidase [Candidatus Eremiobacteraeota bacterium]|nr:D-alanyl-D-alanine carboxypeptidase/D-alanyl-D-alanine-endopeptidase [Candidatus Eremiobacteraeota bacterium]